MSYQPEDRYWTDYLRVALPVVGLLLMLGLFWFWASSVIGDDNSSKPTQTAAAVVLVTQPPPTAQPTQPVQITPENVQPTQPADVQATEPPQNTQPTEPPTQPSQGGSFAVGDTVVTNDAVRMRKGPSTDDEIVDELAKGTVLNVIGDSIEGDQYTWVEVQNPTTGQEGYVASEFLDLES